MLGTDSRETQKKKVLLDELRGQFPELNKPGLENLLNELKRIPELFKKLITETQVNLQAYERYRDKKKTRTDYRLQLDTVLPIKEEISKKDGQK